MNPLFSIALAIKQAAFHLTALTPSWEVRSPRAQINHGWVVYAIGLWNL